VWGRTPAGRQARVVVEDYAGGAWRRLARLRADRYGIFAGRVRLKLARPATTRAAGAPSEVARYRSAVMRDAPSAYWPLDDPAGARARDLAGLRTGSYEGGAKRAAGVLGGLDRAVELDGTDDRVALGRVDAPATVELWLRTAATNEAAGFSDRDDASRHPFLGVWQAVRGRAFDGAGLSGRAWITDGRWHHLVYTHDGTLGRLYVDGRLESSSPVVRTPGESPAYLGYDATLRTYLRGSVDEVALYRYPLTAAQVRAHFAATGRPLSYSASFDVMVPGQTYVRARIVSTRDASLPFSLKRVRDRYVLPLGL
jgi:hypothetical protein